MSSNSVCNHTRDKQIGLPLRGRLILLSLVWLQTELDSTHSYYHYISGIFSLFGNPGIKYQCTFSIFTKRTTKLKAVHVNVYPEVWFTLHYRLKLTEFAMRVFTVRDWHGLSQGLDTEINGKKLTNLRVTCKLIGKSLEHLRQFDCSSWMFGRLRLLSDHLGRIFGLRTVFGNSLIALNGQKTDS